MDDQVGGSNAAHDRNRERRSLLPRRRTDVLNDEPRRTPPPQATIASLPHISLLLRLATAGY
jgi:hypothetical protein